MPIVVPPTGYPASPAPFPASLIPEQERPVVFHILDLLASLGRYERRFALALLLFEHCLAENSDLARQVEGGAVGLGTLDAQTNTSLDGRQWPRAMAHWPYTISAKRFMPSPLALKIA